MLLQSFIGSSGANRVPTREETGLASILHRFVWSCQRGAGRRAGSASILHRFVWSTNASSNPTTQGTSFNPSQVRLELIALSDVVMARSASILHTFVWAREDHLHLPRNLASIVHRFVWNVLLHLLDIVAVDASIVHRFLWSATFSLAFIAVLMLQSFTGSSGTVVSAPPWGLLFALQSFTGSSGAHEHS